MKKTENNVEEYNFMRVLLTILVVIGHSAYLNMSFGFGGVDYTSADSLGNCFSTGYYAFLFQIVGIIYFFHMPAFFFLSGAVFHAGGNKYESVPLENQERLKKDCFDFGIMVEKKGKRLLYPAIVAGVFWMIPLKYLGNGYSSIAVLPYAVINGIFLGQGTGHLWYLYTLFWIFLISCLLFKYFVKERLHVLLLFIFMLGTFYSVIALSLPGGISIMYYLLFFLAGYLFERFRTKLVNGRYTYVLIFMIVIVFISYHFTATVVTTGFFWQDWLKTLGILASTVLVFILSHFLCKTKMAESRIYDMLKKHAFHIYLLHDPVNYVIMNIFHKLFGGKEAINWTYVSIGLSVVRIVGNLLFCMAISALIMKIKPVKTGWILLLLSMISLVVMFYYNLRGLSIEMNVFRA